MSLKEGSSGGPKAIEFGLFTMLNQRTKEMLIYTIYFRNRMNRRMKRAMVNSFFVTADTVGYPN